MKLMKTPQKTKVVYIRIICSVYFCTMYNLEKTKTPILKQHILHLLVNLSGHLRCLINTLCDGNAIFVQYGGQFTQHFSCNTSCGIGLLLVLSIEVLDYVLKSSAKQRTPAVQDGMLPLSSENSSKTCLIFDAT